VLGNEVVQLLKLNYSFIHFFSPEKNNFNLRYNAEKTKVGMYYSTPVYQFRMKCHLCDNHFEMKTDPGVRIPINYTIFD